MQNAFSNNPKSSIVRFEQMLKTDKVYFFDAEDFENIIQYYIDSGNINLAKRALHLALKQHTSHTDLLLLKSEILISDKDYTEAWKLLEVIEKTDLYNQEIFIQKATIYSKNREHLLAINLLIKALESSDDKVELWSLIGMEYMIIEDYQNAITYFKFYLREEPDDHQILCNLLYCFDALQQYEKAIEVLNEILENNPYDEVVWYEIGKQYLNLNRKVDALNAFDFAIISKDQFTGAYIEKGKVLEDLKRFNEAIENYQIAIQIDDPSAYSYLRIAKCHEALHNDTLAIQYFEKSIQEDPSNEKSWVSFIDFYIKKNDTNKAVFYTKKALLIDKDSIAFKERYVALQSPKNIEKPK